MPFNMFGSDMDFSEIWEAEQVFSELSDEILEVQTMEGRGRGRARRAITSQVKLFLLRCGSLERRLPAKIADPANAGVMIKNPARIEWSTFKKECKKQYDEMLAAKDALNQVLDNVW